MRTRVTKTVQPTQNQRQHGENQDAGYLKQRNYGDLASTESAHIVLAL
jgi:hypothetical protein